MYVITFYSFKGGVGRTMALVNVAAELVRRGRKVLVVDFDLEAPGLETYDRLKPPKPHPGIVEYVTEFQRTKQVPNLLDYIYETKPIGKKGGRLWVMPAGRRDPAYSQALANLDWQQLYKDCDGFLLFEDTKKGWEVEDNLKVDYVLIDSRTGETDVLGICTRQLPDSVVLMFTPNEQNLAGLESVCKVIRREETQGLKKKIRLHFVAANVPDLDDEKGKLHDYLTRARKRLEIPEPIKNISKIRRYESFHLLDQSIFTLDRPHSKLARSYRRLLRRLLKDNLEDRDGVLLFLRDYHADHIERRDLGKKFFVTYPNEGDGRQDDVARKDKNSLHKIALRFNEDLHVLTRVVKCFVQEEAYKSAVNVLDKIIALEPNEPEFLIQRSTYKGVLGQMDDAADDLMACLRVLRPPITQLLPSTTLRGRPSVRDFKLPENWLYEFDRRTGLRQECLRRLCLKSPDKLETLAEMFEKGEIGEGLGSFVSFLCLTDDGIPIAARLLRDDVKKRSGQESIFPMPFLQARCWKDIIELHKAGCIKDTFSLALARWAEEGELSEELCKETLEGDEVKLSVLKGNYGLQAIPLLLWRVGQLREAFDVLDTVEHQTYAQTDAADSVDSQEEVFSFWRLRDVSPSQFIDDCHLLRRLFEGEPLPPAFLGLPHSQVPIEKKAASG